ncbi:hypothetical protein BCR43DRAFT_528065 [Syncephalastrum racemosum]|uniref:Uncharacterized protein n=1 Tax=Syncephalastrum racemosum TaxID=13706 RepID=A0A1X2H017_SYNRA|nr:hypothetical protein BCR43DRAFT_528065 [Syncephalastrum racemosum]
MAKQITNVVELHGLMPDDKLVALFAYAPGGKVDLPYEDMSKSLPRIEFAELNLEEADMSIADEYQVVPGLVTFFRNHEIVFQPVPPVPEIIQNAYHGIMG